MNRNLTMLALACIIAITWPLLVSSQSSTGSAYTGYSLSSSGDQSSTVYATDSTPNAAASIPDPDVYLHAKVHVGEIDLDVQNITAKVNLDAQVLQLLQFNAGVDARIDRVFLTIQNVDAEIFLEARLENLLKMINSTLHSIDLNPILATLGSTINNVVDNTVGTLTGTGNSNSNSNSNSASISTLHSSFAAGNSIPTIEPSLSISNNILYSVNNFEKNSHMNQVLRSDGRILSEQLDNNGNILSVTIVGSYVQNMSYTGETRSTTLNGMTVEEQLWRYKPIPGIEIDCAIFQDAAGSVVDAKVIAETSADANATVSPDKP